MSFAADKKTCKFIIQQTCFPPVTSRPALPRHVYNKKRKIILPQKVQNRKNAKFYGREYFMFYSKLSIISQADNLPESCAPGIPDFMEQFSAF